MKAHYIAVFAIGGFSHMVNLYPHYTPEKGLHGEPLSFRCRRKDVLMREIKSRLTKIQIERLSLAMKYRQDAIIDEEGKILKP